MYMQPVENTYGKNFITKFDKLRKNLKAHKIRENLNYYSSIIAEVKVKLVRKEDTLKGKLHELEMKFLQESDSNSVYPNNGSALADKDEYNNIINKLKCLKEII